jgi:hypothetical protein
VGCRRSRELKGKQLDIRREYSNTANNHQDMERMRHGNNDNLAEMREH